MVKDTPYSEYYKRKMQEKFEDNDSITKPIKFKPLIRENYSLKQNKKSIDFFILLILILLLITGIVSMVLFLPRNSLSLILISFFGIIILFLILTILHKFYERSIIKTHPALILLIVYILLIANMILGSKVYSVDWAFLGFIIAAVVIYDTKIDSRFMILPALLILGFIPFLLISKNNNIAETFAIFVYYFLVIGVFLEVVEYMKKTENSLVFENFTRGVIKEIDWMKACIFIGIISIFLIILGRFYDTGIWKWAGVYCFIICLICYWIKNTSEKK